jgi:hypothetical protein
LAANTDQVSLAQPYIPYFKGTLALHAVAQILDRGRFESVVADFITDYRYSTDYPVASELLRRLLAIAEPDEKEPINHWLDDLVWFENELEEMTVLNGSNEPVEIEVQLTTARFRDDGKGNLTPIPGEYPIELGAVDADGRVFHTSTVEVGPGQHRVTIRPPTAPAGLKLDPRWLLLEVERANNELK